MATRERTKRCVERSCNPQSANSVKIASIRVGSARKASTDFGSKCLPRWALQVIDAFVDRPRVLVGTLADQRVEHVGDRDHARDQRNVLAVQAVGVAGAVEFLVMAERDDRAHADRYFDGLPFRMS